MTKSIIYLMLTVSKSLLMQRLITVKTQLKMQERMDKLEQELKELELQSQQEIGKFLLKSWEIDNEDDSEKLFEVIEEMKSQALNLLKQKESQGMGKSEEEETQTTNSL